MGHWYDQHGNPCHTQPKADGGTRDTTLRDARKLNLFKSVTSHLDARNKPGLNVWAENDCIVTCGTHRRAEGEPYDEYKDRIRQIRAIRKDKILNFGTTVHNALETLLGGGDVPPQDIESPDGQLHQLLEITNPVLELFDDNAWTVLETEQILVGDGYAGTADIVYECGTEYGIIDFKTCKDATKWRPSPENKIQIALYHIARFGAIEADAVGYNVAISREENIGAVKAVKYDAVELDKWARIGLLQVELNCIEDNHWPKKGGAV